MSKFCFRISVDKIPRALGAHHYPRWVRRCSIGPVFTPPLSVRRGSLNLSSPSCHSCHVQDAFHSCYFLTFPSHVYCCLEIIREADKEGPHRASTCLPVASMRLSHRRPGFASRTSPRIRSSSEHRRQIDKVVEPNRERPICVFRHYWRGCRPGVCQPTP